MERFACFARAIHSKAAPLLSEGDADGVCQGLGT